MSTITNDNEFKSILGKLTTVQQRIVGALFVENVLNLCDDRRIKNAIAAAKNSATSLDELAAAHKSAKAASVERFTPCGKDADWLKQAGHFVAEASATCVTPDEQLMQMDNLAWNTAMHARMAKTCETIAAGEGSENQEREQQYQILGNFMKNT